MASVYDVAAYILSKKSPMTAMKLHKLVYYSQAWSLVWDDAPLFHARIEAWANGPVCPTLYKAHRGQYRVDRIHGGNPSKLTKKQKETVDAVLNFYARQSSQWLSDLTHAEKPWQDARKGISPEDRGNQEITLASMAEYYSSLLS